jgi:hypothetical protein
MKRKEKRSYLNIDSAVKELGCSREDYEDWVNSVTAEKEKIRREGAVFAILSPHGSVERYQLVNGVWSQLETLSSPAATARVTDDYPGILENSYAIIG